MRVGDFILKPQPDYRVRVSQMKTVYHSQKLNTHDRIEPIGPAKIPILIECGPGGGGVDVGVRLHGRSFHGQNIPIDGESYILHEPGIPEGSTALLVLLSSNSEEGTIELEHKARSFTKKKKNRNRLLLIAIVLTTASPHTSDTSNLTILASSWSG